MCATFFFNDTATTEIYTLSLHDALPIFTIVAAWMSAETGVGPSIASGSQVCSPSWADLPIAPMNSRMQIAVMTSRSEEHTSELQSRQYLVCRLLLEKKQRYLECLVPR